MPKPVFKEILANTLSYEGGFTVDHAGATNKGVTQTTYDAYRTSQKKPKQAVKDISDDEVENIYRTDFFEKQKYDKMPHSIAGLMFDFGVNSGPARANKILQKIVGAKPDGAIGPNTLFAVEKFIVDKGEQALRQKIAEARSNFVNFLASENPDKYGPYIKGWSNRISGIDKRYATEKNASQKELI